jgi:hypothetical protein
VNNCAFKDDLSITGTGRTTDPRADAFCDVRPPFQPLVKGQVAYPLPGAINLSATFQSLAGPELRAQYPLTNGLVASSLGRNFTSVAPTVDLVPSGTLYGDRIYQTDLRVTRVFRAGHATVRPTFSIYNLFNANPIQTYNTTYGSAWLAPTVILQARLADLGVQIDF